MPAVSGAMGAVGLGGLRTPLGPGLALRTDTAGQRAAAEQHRERRREARELDRRAHGTTS
ncbi:MAG: hypothetical protein WKF96_20865 [Solirubrobacteraceae bacterium]